MNNERPLMAMTLRSRHQVPRWYSLASIHNPHGLELFVHFETWQRMLSFCETEIQPKNFQVKTKGYDLVNVKFPFPADWSGDDCKSLQKTLSVLFGALDSVRKDTQSDKFQLVTYGIMRSVNELKGYVLDAYISYEMKCLLAKNRDKASEIATEAMRKAVRRLHHPVRPEEFKAFVDQEGFLCLYVSDGGGTFLGADYRDRELSSDRPVGYSMTGDNIDSPSSQLIFLSALAAISAWGDEQ